MDRFDLGTHTKRITTRSERAQQFFNFGLNWCYGFNHEEGVACFHEVLKYDPDCAMAHWGIAYGTGPFYNNLWRQLCVEEAETMTRTCHRHIESARVKAANATVLEIMLIEALAMRFQKPHAVSGDEFDRWDDDYANAMRRVYYEFRDDHDVAALFAEALMTRTAWKLWNVWTGAPTPGADTLEALQVIEQSIACNDDAGVQQHPAILHLHIHVTEMSQEPERAMRSADILGTLCPDAGHLSHMPGHTYMLCGDYERARLASVKAIAADQLYVDYAGPGNFYTSARAHDLHLMMFTCMFLGQYKPAIQAAEQLCETLSKEVLGIKGRPHLAFSLEGYYSMKMHVLVRFGRWQDILEAQMPDDPELYCVTTAMYHYAKGVAHAFMKQHEAADRQCLLFSEAYSRISERRVFFNNPAITTLGVGQAMLAGEVAYHKGDFDIAYEHLRESVRRDDALEYSEPWPWMHPPRHALAALLAEQGHFEEAEDVYQTDLGLNDKLKRCAQHRDNIWALHGLVECLAHRGEAVELPKLKKKLAKAQLYADIVITSSCLCRTHTSNLESLPCCKSAWEGN